MLNETTPRLAVTGATGFIGRAVLEHCVRNGIACRGISRTDRPAWANNLVQWAVVSSYDNGDDLAPALTGAKCVLHLADDPHRGHTRSSDEAGRNATAIIGAMRAVGASRAIVASSVYARQDDTSGANGYGSGKRAIEQAFLSTKDIDTIVLRLPPVYGPGSKGSISALASLVRRGFPLPLGGATAARAYLSIGNLTSLVAAIIESNEGEWRAAAGMTFEPWDGDPTSTRDLVRHMGRALDTKPRLVPFPVWALRIVGSLAGKGELVEGAVASLEVAPIAALHHHFGWKPVDHMPDSLVYLKG